MSNSGHVQDVHGKLEGKETCSNINCIGLAPVLVLLFLVQFILVLLSLPWFVLVYLGAKAILKTKSCQTNWLPYFAEPDTRRLSLNVTGFATVNSKIEPCQLKFTVERLLNATDNNTRRKFSRLQEYPTGFMGYTFWVQEKRFNLDNHISILPCADGDVQSRELCVANVLKAKTSIEDWPENQSPWEILLMDGPEGNDSTKTILGFCFHFSLWSGDGTREFFGALFPSQAPLVAKRPSGICISQKLSTAICHNISIPFSKIESINFYSSVSTNAMQLEMQNKYRFSFSKSISMEKVNAMAKKYGVSCNVILYSAVGASIQRILEKGAKTVPNYVFLTVPSEVLVFPFNLTTQFAHTNFQLPIGRVSMEERLYKTSIYFQSGKISKGNLFEGYSAVASVLLRRLKEVQLNHTIPTERPSNYSVTPLINVLCIRGTSYSNLEARVKEERQNHGISQQIALFCVFSSRVCCHFLGNRCVCESCVFNGYRSGFLGYRVQVGEVFCAGSQWNIAAVKCIKSN